MDATQQIEDSFFGEEEDSGDQHELGEGKRETEPLAVLKVFKNNHLPETEVPLYQGENVLGRDPTSCRVPLQARSVSGRHAIISISVFGPNDRRAHSEVTETLLWDLGSLNGTRKGRVKLTPHVRYALTEGDSVVLADLPCQYISLKNTEKSTDTSSGDGGIEAAKGLMCTSSSLKCGTVKGIENGGRKSMLPPVPVWTDEAKSLQSLQATPQKSERTLVPESDSDSDGEKHGRRETRMRRGCLASDSASSELSSPTCSTFLTPANKVISESEDESSVAPSPALKDRFSKTGNNTDVSSDSSKADPLHFNIDSDTDAEDEEADMIKSTPGIRAAVRVDADAVNPVDVHMDNDTDVEVEETEKVKSDLEAKQDSVNSLTMDSDTDVEENEPVKTDTTLEAALEEKKEAVSYVQLNVESDTDVEDEDAPDIQGSRPPTSHVAEFNMSSDTDVEEDEETAKATEPPSASEAESKGPVKLAKSEDSVKDPDAKTLRHQSGRDTDVEDDDVTEIQTPVLAKVTGNSQTCATIQTAETVWDEFRLDSDTDVEEDDEKMEGKEQKCAEAAGSIVHSSTPRGAGLSEEEMETQAFLSPSQLFKGPVLPSLLHPSVSPGGISHSDDDFAVAETQSFVCDAAQAEAAMLDETPQSLDGAESRHSGGASCFQLGLSDSSHRVPGAEKHDRKPAEEDWQLQATQLYAVKHSEGSTKIGQAQLDLDATQAYTDLMGQEEEKDGGEEDEETQPPADLAHHSGIHTAEAQLIKHGGQDEDNRDHDPNKESVASEAERKAEKDENGEMHVDSHLFTADTLLIIRSPRQKEQTQPYAFLTAQIQKEREETEHEEHTGRDQVIQETDEGGRAQNEVQENAGQENDEEKEKEKSEQMVMGKENEMTRGGSEEEKKRGDENKRVESDNKGDEAQTQPAEAGTILETLPLCEEKKGQGEEENKTRTCKIPGRRKPTAHVEPKQSVESDQVIRMTIPETQPMCEEEEGQENELNEPGSSGGTQPVKIDATQPLEADDNTDVAIAETLPMGEEEENKPNYRRPGRRRRTANVEPKQHVESDRIAHVIILETQPMCEEEEEGQEEGQENEQLNEPGSSGGTQPVKAEATQPLEADNTNVAIAETLPMGEEEERQEEEENKPNYRRPGRRRRTANVEPKQHVESDRIAHVIIPKTQPMCEEEEEQEEGQQSEAIPSKRSSTRRQDAKDVTPVKSHVTISKTLPMCKVEEGQEEKPENEAKSNRKSRRGRPSRQPLEPDSAAAAVKLKEDEEEQDSRRSLRGKEKGRVASGKGASKAGRAVTEKEMRGRRGKEEQEEDGEEEVHQGNKGRGRRNLKRKSNDEDKIKLEPVKAENKEIEHLKKDEKKSKRLQRDAQEEKDSMRLEKEEREECEKREQEDKDRLERETIEMEKNGREEKEMKDREEMKRVEREKRLGKERRHREEKDRLEQEKTEKENKEKEELERKMRARQRLEEKQEKEKQEEKEREKTDREEKEQLENEMKEEKEKQEKELGKKEEEEESKDAVGKEKRQAPGKPKTGLGRRGKRSQKEEEQGIEEGTEKTLETEQEMNEIQKQECGEERSNKQEDETAESEAKPRRSRRTSRKSTAPSADVEDEGGPAKRTRSRSNSSNSVCSEQSTQDSLSKGRRRGRRRETATELSERGRPSGRRRTTTAPSGEKEDLKPAAHTLSNSRSSDRSGSSVATQSRGKRSKSVKAEEPEKMEEEKGEQAAVVGRGRGRGRGGKRPGANDAEADKDEAEVAADSEDSVMSQSSSRGRKRGADVSMLSAETPQPTLKTPRRSLAGPTHKVLFTGVVDEDGEKVLVRLGGGLANGVTDMTHLVTDKVRRTVKFLCAVARGVPIVTPDWLSKCGKAGSFLSPNGFLVKDVEQEKRFNFSLQEALRVASSQPLLQGYKIHVTPSVRPEPAQMKEIITCCGARFLPKMPSAHKAQTVVVMSCEEDRSLCERARSLSLPVVSAEFLLTGILQQKVDLQTHVLFLSPTAAVHKPAARSRGK